MVAEHAAPGSGVAAAARLLSQLESRGWLEEEPVSTLGSAGCRALRLRGLSTLWHPDATAETRSIAAVPAIAETGMLFSALQCQFECCCEGPVEVSDLLFGCPHRAIG